MSRLCQPPARAEYRKGKFDDWFWQFSIKGVNVNFLSIFQFISEILLACLPVSMGPCRSSWCIFSEYLKYTRINLMCIQFISKASIAGSYRREIFTVMSAYEHFSPHPLSPPLCHYRNRGDNFRFKISKSRKGLRWQNYHLNRGDPFVGRDWRANNCK